SHDVRADALHHRAGDGGQRVLPCVGATHHGAPGTLMRQALDSLGFVLVLLAIWQGLHWFAGDIAIASPLDTARRAAALLASDQFWPHFRETFAALGYALLIAVLGGLTIGLLLGLHRLSGEVAEPILVSLYSLPKSTLYPLILLVFGLGMSAKVAFGAIHGIIPVAIFTLGA